MRRVIGLVFLLLGLLYGGAGFAAMRCDDRLVSEGDRAHQLLTVCGAPDYRQAIAGTYLPGVGLLVDEERWYYNFGPHRLIRVVRIQQDRIASIDTAGYGFRPSAQAPCRPQALGAGMTLLELLARCGEPDHKHSRIQLIPPLPPDRPYYEVVPIEEWTYSFGPNEFARIVTITGATVRLVESGRRY
jgi:hypothetical protein